MLKEAFRNIAVGLNQTCKLFKLFHNGRISVDDVGSSGRISAGNRTENMAKVREVLLKDRRRAIHSAGDIARLLYMSHEVNVRRTAVKSAPRLPGNAQMGTRPCHLL
jgi:hypothetical protein